MVNTGFIYSGYCIEAQNILVINNVD